MTTTRPKRVAAEAALSLLGGGQKRTTMADYREERLARMGWLGTLPDDVHGMLAPYLLRDNVDSSRPREAMLSMLAMGGVLAEAVLQQPDHMKELIHGAYSSVVFGDFRRIRTLASDDVVRRLYAAVMNIQPNWDLELAAALRPELLTARIGRVTKRRRATVLMLSGRHDDQALEFLLSNPKELPSYVRLTIEFACYDLLVRLVNERGAIAFDYETLPQAGGIDEFIRVVFNDRLYASALHARAHALQIIRVGRLDHLQVLDAAAHLNSSFEQDMLAQAIGRSRIHIVQWLLETRPALQVDSSTVEYAIQRGSYEIVHAITPRCSDLNTCKVFGATLDCEDDRIFRYMAPLFDGALIHDFIAHVVLANTRDYRRLLDTPNLRAALPRTKILDELCREFGVWTKELHEELEAAGVTMEYNGSTAFDIWYWSRCYKSVVYIIGRPEFRADADNAQHCLTRLLRTKQRTDSKFVFEALFQTGLVTPAMAKTCVDDVVRDLCGRDCGIWLILDNFRFHAD